MKSTSTEESRLCELPNEVVHNILGQLPIREAVRSCVIAKRWQHLWRSMPCLIFRIKDHHYRRRSSACFNKLVHRVCTLRDPSYPIQRFELESDIRSYNSAALINDSIENAVIKGGVQYLFIHLYSCSVFLSNAPLPCCIFSSQTLVHCHLYLDMNIKPIPITLPDHISLPRLKVLYLNRILFSDSTKSIQQLFSCPLLEELDMISCRWDFSYWPTNDASFTISPPNLKRMSLKDTSLLSSMRMHYQSLKEFNYIGALSQKLHISGIKQLEHAEVIYTTWSFVNHSSSMLLNCLSTTKRLTLWTDYLKRIDLSTQLLEELPQFNNLIELNLQGSTTLPKTVHTMFRKFPHLQILRMEDWGFKYTAGGVETSADDQLIDPIPLHHLKKIIVTCNMLRCIDIRLMALLLMSSAVLGELVLMNRSPGRSNDDDRVLQILRSLPKVSKDCRISHTYTFEKASI